MSKFDYNRIKATADRLIDRFGQPAVLRSINITGGTSYDPVFGAPTDRNCTLVELEWSLYELQSNRVQVNDKKVLLAVGDLTVQPKQTDEIVYNDIVHSIVGRDSGYGIKPLSPGGTIVLYEVHLRR
jgi:hypothetical protein